LRANRAGKLAGANAMGQRIAAPPVMGTAVFKFFGLQIARTGLSEREASAAGFEPVAAGILASTRAHYISGGGKLSVWLLADRESHQLLGGAMVGPESAAHRIDTVVAALHAGLTVEQLYEMDLAYAPTFGPAWSPLLTCASQLIKAIG
jgi:NADPH-dependent 2,4-dienoyl-CoA reductase/sulfur reductase-like enzyme